ncbi:MAG: hypothetical protein IJB79_00465 [Candidatus Gastranaerophilales bacterium]|nr:hypothetical protein [Candidatus Gastranaerophilales bacterium]
MHITPISTNFKSSFRYLNNVNQKDAWGEIMQKCSNVNYTEQPRYDIESLKKGIASEMFISVDDCYDKTIEAILKSKGIDFQKRSKKETLSPYDIALRIVLTPFDEQQNRKLVELDTEKLEECFQRSMFYLSDEDLIGREYYHYQEVKDFIALGSLIDAPSICLVENNNQLSAEFRDGRHRYCVMRDLGMKKIPVAISSDSINLAIKHGLITK